MHENARLTSDSGKRALYTCTCRLVHLKVPFIQSVLYLYRNILNSLMYFVEACLLSTRCIYNSVSPLSSSLINVGSTLLFTGESI